MPELATPIPVVVTAPGAKATFQRWIARGDAVGVFSNHDLGHRECGRLVFIPLDAEEQNHLPVGKAHAPDNASWGLGWRYLLDEIVTDISRFQFAEA